ESARKGVVCNSRRGFQGLSCCPRPRYPPFPKGGSVEDVQKWNKECFRVSEILKKLNKDRDCDIPIMTEPKDPYTTEAIQSSRDKVVVLCAACIIVSVPTSWMMERGYHNVLA
ncbi:hypothetical protein E2562_032000, partial [Oryza meyeriana var. granulata]